MGQDRLGHRGAAIRPIRHTHRWIWACHTPKPSLPSEIYSIYPALSFDKPSVLVTKCHYRTTPAYSAETSKRSTTSSLNHPRSWAVIHHSTRRNRTRVTRGHKNRISGGNKTRIGRGTTFCRTHTVDQLNSDRVHTTASARHGIASELTTTGSWHAATLPYATTSTAGMDTKQ